MMELVQQLGAFVMFFFALACLSVAIILGFMLRRNEAKTEQRLRQARADITDMTILFQTMRDIIGQQKALAKDFNEELEHKMGQVKHILNLGMEKNKQLYEKQQRIVTELEEAQVQIDGLFRQLSHASKASQAVVRPAPPVERPEVQMVRKQDAPPPEPAAPSQPPSRPTPSPNPRPSTSVLVRSATSESRETPGVASRPAASVERSMPPRPAPAPSSLTPAEEARLADTGVTKAPFSSWIAEDLLGSNGSNANARPTVSPPKPAPSSLRVPLDDEESDVPTPSNGEAAREAFRALLNMPMNESAQVAPPEMPGQTRAMAAVLQEHGNGQGEIQFSAPLQQRVLEYSEAGMTVAEVSRELGIGKGEVRLMLSLARQAHPGPS